MNYIYNKIECSGMYTRKNLLERGGKKNLEAEVGRDEEHETRPIPSRLLPFLLCLLYLFIFGGEGELRF